jgi:hypothetical protein
MSCKDAEMGWAGVDEALRGLPMEDLVCVGGVMPRILFE